MTESEAALLAKCRRGDRSAFEQLVRMTTRLVYARIYLETGDLHLTEDLTQETFLRAWRSIHQCREASDFRAWLLAIAHAAVIDDVRRRSRKKRGGATVGNVESMDPADPQLNPSQTAEDEDDKRQVLTILRNLPEMYRTPLMMRYIAGDDFDTIATQLNISNGSLRGLLQRGMAMLRKQLIATEQKATQ